MKKMNLIMLTLTLASAAAMADTARYSATLAQPLSAKKAVIANGNIWRCEESTCVLTSQPNDADSVRSCRALMRQTGTLTAYGLGDKLLDSAKLAQCNAH